MNLTIGIKPNPITSTSPENFGHTITIVGEGSYDECKILKERLIKMLEPVKVGDDGNEDKH